MNFCDYFHPKRSEYSATPHYHFAVVLADSFSLFRLRFHVESVCFDDDRFDWLWSFPATLGDVELPII